MKNPPSEEIYALVMMRSRSDKICTTSSRIPGLLTLSSCRSKLHTHSFHYVWFESQVAERENIEGQEK